MEHIFKTLEKVSELNERTSARIASFFAKNADNSLELVSTEGLGVANKLKLYSSGEVQVFRAEVYGESGTAITPHAHARSIEYVIVLHGSLVHDGQVYHKGEVFIVPEGQPHTLESKDGPASCIVIMIPPEELYE